MSKAFFDEFQMRVLGLARQFDFWIKLTSPNAYSNLTSGSSSILPVYVHEWTHYVQLLTTSLANLVSETERMLFFAKLELIIFTSAASSGKLILPLESMLNDVQSDQKVAATIGNIRLHTRQMRTLCASWSELLSDDAFELGELQKMRPFHLDLTARCLIFKSNSGREVSLPITATQLLEHAAKANELMLCDGNIKIEQLVPAMFDYFGMFLYLVQEGRLKLVNVADGVVRIELPSGNDSQTRTRGALICMYASCQIGQMLYLDPEHEKINEDPSVEFVEERLRASTKFFCRMIENFDTVASMLNMGNLNAKDMVEKLCHELRLPSYDFALGMQYKRACDAIKKMDNNEKPIIGDMSDWSYRLDSTLASALKVDANDISSLSVDFQELYNKLFLERSIVALEVLVQRAEATINPLFNAEGIPAPYVVFETDKGARRTVLQIPGLGKPKVVEIPMPLMSHFLELSMLVDKVIFDKNLACYRDGVEEEEARVSRASLGCSNFAACFRRKKTDRLTFCTKEDWADMAAGQYRAWEAISSLFK